MPPLSPEEPRAESNSPSLNPLHQSGAPPLASVAGPDPLFDRFAATRMPVYQTFAESAGFSVEFGDKTCFNHTEGAVVLEREGTLRTLREKPDRVDFDVFHELGHYKELYDDPQGYKKVIEEGSKPPDGKSIFRLYNCLMDIYVNTNIANRLPQYRGSGGFSDDVVDYYRRDLFPTRDWSDPKKNPLCFQFSDYLLQLGMGAEEGITLSPEVRNVLAEGTTFAGQHYSFKELIDQYLRPVLHPLPGDSWTGAISQRKYVIDEAIRPIFERLLQQDKAQGREQQIKEGGEGKQKGQPSLEDLKNALPGAEQWARDKKLSNADKASKERKKQIEDIAKAEQLTPEEAKDFAERFERLQPIINDLAKRWDELAIPSTLWETREIGHFTTGSNFDVRMGVARFSDIVENPAKAEVMTRRLLEPTEVIQPKEILLWVLPDLSGSMKDDQEVLRDLCLVLAASMATRNLDAEIHGGESRCTLGIEGFHKITIPLLQPTKEIKIRDIMRIYKQLVANGDDTNDDLALAEVAKTHTGEHRERLRSGEVVELLLEITDGCTRNSERTKALIGRLEGNGTWCRSIKINRHGGAPDVKPKEELPADGGEGVVKDPPKPAAPPQGEADQFREIWGLRGRIVPSAKYLPQAVSGILSEIAKGRDL